MTLLGTAPPLPLPALVDMATGLAAASPVPGPPTDGRRAAVRLLATPAYEAWLLVWPPGTGIEAHDHGDASGAFVVVDGELTETRWSGHRSTRRRLRPGHAAAVPAGAVHGIAASGRRTAVSVHVYSPPLTEMRFYDGDGHVRDVWAAEDDGG